MQNKKPTLLEELLADQPWHERLRHRTHIGFWLGTINAIRWSKRKLDRLEYLAGCRLRLQTPDVPQYDP